MATTTTTMTVMNDVHPHSIRSRSTLPRHHNLQDERHNHLSQLHHLHHHQQQQQRSAFVAPLPTPHPATRHIPISLSFRPRHTVPLRRVRARPTFLYASSSSSPPTPQTSLPEPLPDASSIPSSIPSDLSSSTSSPTPSSSSSSTLSPPAIPDDPTRIATDETLNQSIAKIALPALGTLALDPLVALADMACVGHLGARAIGGVGIGNNVFNLSFTCFNFLALATTPLIARAYAQDDRRAASKLIAQGLWIAFISGTVACIIVSTFSVPILKFFGANAAILPYARDYLRVRIVAAPFFLTAMVANGSFRGFQDTRTPLFIGLFANLLNLILYPTLIFVFGLGTTGAGIAMTTGQICSGVILLALLVKTKKLALSDMSLANFPRFSALLPLLRTGLVLSVRTFSIYSTISFATATTARMGTVQIAAFEIGRQIFALFARLFDAVSVAAQSLIALSLGRGNLPLARTIGNRILLISVAMGIAFTGLLMVIVNLAPTLFTSSPAVITTVKATFPFMAAIQPINGLVFVLDGIYTAGRKFSILSSVIFCSACIATSFLYMVRFASLPLQFVWVGLNIMMIIRVAALGSIYMSKWSPVPSARFAKKTQDAADSDAEQTALQQNGNGNGNGNTAAASSQ